MNILKNVGDDGKYHFVYKTVCKSNGKYYIGKHSTSNLDDGYLGSGKLLKQALKKYSKENFVREILCFCSSEEEVYLKEHEIVTQEVVDDEMSYNMKLGGEGGQKIYSSEEVKERKKETDRKYYLAHKDRCREAVQKFRQTNKDHNREYHQGWQSKNRDHYREYQREYHREYQKEWYEAHKDQILARMKAKRDAKKNMQKKI